MMTTTHSRRAAAILDSIDRWTVAPEDQGQIIEVAYALDRDDDLIVRQTTDRSDRSVTYAVADLDQLVGEWEPWTGAPQVRGDWRPLV